MNDWQQHIADSHLHGQLRSDAELDASVDETLAERRQRGGDVWLFGYGSLLWNPQVRHEEKRVGVVHGYHRGLYLWSRINRGTPQRPGLVLGLDRGGSVSGLAYRIPKQIVLDELRTLWRREMMLGSYFPRWLSFRSGRDLIEVLAFVVDRRSSGYTGPLPESETIAVLRDACGRYGTCADYVIRTVEALRSHGLHDRRLERLYANLDSLLAECGNASGSVPANG
jgi:cation transport protein ChaC